MALDSEKPDLVTGNQVNYAQNLENLLSTIQNHIQRFRQANKNTNSRNSKILNDIEDILVTASTQTSFSSLPIDDANGTQTTIPIVAGFNDPCSAESNEIQKKRTGTQTRDIRSEEHIDEFQVTKGHRNNMQSTLEHTTEALAAEGSARAAEQMPYDVDDGIIRFRPNQDQWLDFDDVLRRIKSFGTAQNGVCKIAISGVSTIQETEDSLPNYFAYKTQTRKNGTVALDLISSSITSSLLLTGGIPDLTAREAVNMFEGRAKSRLGLRNARYCIDIRARTKSERRSLGLPKSPIWPETSSARPRHVFQVFTTHTPTEPINLLTRHLESIKKIVGRILSTVCTETLKYGSLSLLPQPASWNKSFARLLPMLD